MRMGVQLCTTTSFYFLGQLEHGFFRYGIAFAASQRGVSGIHSSEDFGPPALSFFPQRERLGDCVPFVLKPTALNGNSNKGFLIGCEMNFHCVRLGIWAARVNYRLGDS